MERQKIKKFYVWMNDLLFQDKVQPEDWYVDAVLCNNCYYNFFHIMGEDIEHPIRYCPSCGGFIDGVENPNPPIKKKSK